MTYLVAVTEVVYPEEYLIKEMLATGEYGINGYPISHEAIVEFVKKTEWQIEHDLFLDRYEVPVAISIKNEDYDTLFYAEKKMETL